MYVLTSPLGLCQQRRGVSHLGGTIRLLARHSTHVFVGFDNEGIRRFTYQIHGLIRLTPFWVVLLSVGRVMSASGVV